MLKKEIKIIDGETFELTQMMATASLRLLPRLGAAMGPALSKLSITSKDIGHLDLTMAGEAIAALTQKLTSDELDYIVQQLLYSLAVNGKPCEPGPGKAFDIIFAGRTLLVFKLLKFALEVNYGDFFAAAGSLAVQSPAVSLLKG